MNKNRLTESKLGPHISHTLQTQYMLPKGAQRAIQPTSYAIQQTIHASSLRASHQKPNLCDLNEQLLFAASAKTQDGQTSVMRKSKVSNSHNWNQSFLQFLDTLDAEKKQSGPLP
jgi:hypothetical protein